MVTYQCTQRGGRALENSVIHGSEYAYIECIAWDARIYLQCYRGPHIAHTEEPYGPKGVI